MRPYQNYHKHTYYTNPKISDSVVSPIDYAKKASELGAKILSSCEHGWQGAPYEYWKAAKEYDLKYLMSAEAYWVKDRFEKDGTNCHIWIGAKNENGRECINDILSEANITGRYKQARIDIPLILSLPRDDVWVTSACIAGWRYEESEEIMKKFADHFCDNFFLEVQYHLTDEQAKLNERILNLRRQTGMNIIMGCDSHYIKAGDDRNRTDYLVSKGINYPDEEGWFLDYPDGDTAYNRFAKQSVLSGSEIELAINNTNVFLDVEEYDQEIFSSDIKMPSLYENLSQEERNNIYKTLVWQGWDNYKNDVPKELHETYKKEIQGEIDVVEETKMADYFIDNYYIIKKGKENGGHLTKTGRGSAVSFITNKLLGFTEVDRIEAPVKMYPERFMSAARILQSGSLPDIDFNVAPVEPFARAQQEVLGGDHAYPMISYGTQQVSAAWKLYAKSQGVPFEIANEVSEQIKKYENAVKNAEDDEKDDIQVDDYIGQEYKEIFEKSADYRGVICSWSIAPCSYLLYQKSIRRKIGLVNIKDHLCCLMDGKWAEACHFLKNDLLKVAVVDLIYRTYERIGIEPPPEKELRKMCTPDDPCWKLYASGCTVGLNQVEKVGTSARVGKYKPTNISELCAFVAAIRPGFKSMYKTFEGRDPFSYGVSAFDSILQTPEMPNSFCLYQEQEMLALNYAGIPMSDCYTAIKNIAKKRVEKVLAYKEKFIKGFSESIIKDDGKSKEEADVLAQNLWQIIEDSSRYSFNACLSGDTKIQRYGVKKESFHPTIQEMYFIKNSKEYAKATGHESLHEKYNRCGYGNAYSMFDDLRVHKNKIVDIRPSGFRMLYEVTVSSGEKIVCTDNHKFPTPNGIKHLSELKAKNMSTSGDFLYVIGKYERCKTKYPFTDGNFKSNIPVLGQRGFQKIEDGSSVVFNNFREEKVNSKSCCEICGKIYSSKERFEVHHKDFDRTNNSRSNFCWCCAGCHKKEHYRNNNRIKAMEKGLPTELREIISITPLRVELTFDVEMADPAHTLVSESGLIASNSHSYCVSCDSLYSAWAKAHYPCEFYETLLIISEIKGDKEKMALAKEEAENYFGIKFPPFRFGQDNRTIKAIPEENTILNCLSSIKGFGKSVSELLYECSQQGFTDFLQILKWLDERSFKSSKIIPLIKIGYFQDFGNERELLSIIEIFDFFKQGKAKNIAKVKVNGWLQEIIPHFATGLTSKQEEAKSWTIKDIDGLLNACIEYIYNLKLDDLPYKLKANNQNEILGYVDLTTGREEDRKKLFISEVYDLKDRFRGGIWKYKVKAKSIGSGKNSSWDINPIVMNLMPIKSGSIIQVKEWNRDKKGYLNLVSYDILSDIN